MTRATDLAPLTPQDVGAMGLVLEDQECSQQHVAGQKPHRHMTLLDIEEHQHTPVIGMGIAPYCRDCGLDTEEGSAS